MSSNVVVFSYVANMDLLIVDCAAGRTTTFHIALVLAVCDLETLGCASFIEKFNSTFISMAESLMPDIQSCSATKMRISTLKIFG